MTEYEITKNLLQNKKPQLWKACSPRLYQAPIGYGNPVVATTSMVSSIALVQELGVLAPGSAVAIYSAACVAKQYNFPVLYVSKELLSAIANTELPEDLTWNDVKLPFPAGVLVLPKNILKHPDGSNCDILGWARIEGEVRFDESSIRTGAKNPSVSVWTGLADSKDFPTFFTGYEADKSFGKFGLGKNSAHPSIFNLELSADEDFFLKQCREMVASVFLVLEAKKSLLTDGKKVGIHKKSRSEIWQPVFIGKEYKVVKEPQGGTHASPQIHWRRGHYRQQRYGTGFVEIKKIWIEPVLVGMK